MSVWSEENWVFMDAATWGGMDEILERMSSFVSMLMFDIDISVSKSGRRVEREDFVVERSVTREGIMLRGVVRLGRES